MDISYNQQKPKPIISVIVPVYNEARSLPELHERLLKALRDIGKSFEIIYTDDGSCDNSWEVLSRLDGARLIRLKSNFGQTIALAVGIKEAVGTLIVTIDSDLENDPADISRLITHMEQGFDVVTGWRQKRWQNASFTRKIPSILANRLLSFVAGTTLHDVGCTLKVFKKELFDGISFSGGMHRMLLLYMARRGARIGELPVLFAPRKFGHSNYGLKRTLDVLFDIMAFYFFERFHNRPLHFFGLVGTASFLGSFLTFIWMVILKFWYHTTFVATPLPVLAVTFGVVGVQFLLMGLLAELIHRSNHESANVIGLYVKEIK